MDLAALEQWMDAHSVEQGPITRLHRVGGGTQNIMVAFRRGDGRFVLRCPPADAVHNGAATVHREASVLHALGTTAIPHARFVGAEVDEAVLGHPFLITEWIDGVAVTGRWRPTGPDARQHWQVASENLALDLAKLGDLDPDELALGEFHRPGSFLERQVTRWQWQLAQYTNYSGYAGSALPHVDGVGNWLEANRPQDQRPGVVHGDVHLGNVMYRHDTPVVAALVDWELWTIGDPLLDLGQLLATWPDNDCASTVGPVASVDPSATLATERELMAVYSAATTRDVSTISWYRVLAGFRLAIILEGSFARACAGLASQRVGAELHAAAVRLLEDAHGVIAAA